MAESKPIQSQEIVDLEGLRKEIDLTISEAKNLQKAFTDTLISTNKILQANSSKRDTKSIDDTTNALKKSNEVLANKLKLDQQVAILEARKIQTQQQETKLLQEQLKLKVAEQREIDKKIKLQEKEAKALKDQSSAYKKASKELSDLSETYKDLAIKQKLGGSLTEEESKKISELSVRIKQLDSALKEADKETGKFNREVGNYKQAIEEAIQSTGAFGGIIQKITYFVELYESTIKAKKAVMEKDIAVTEASTVAHVENTVAVKAEEAATEKLTLAKRVLNAVTSPTGLIIAAVVAVAALTKAVYDVNQSLQDALTLGKAFAQDSFWGTGDQFYNVAKATIDLRKEIGALNLELQVLKDNEGDLTEISNDESLSFGQRQKAFKEASEARVKFAEKNLELAKREFDIADQTLKAEESRIGVGAGNALQEFYDKQVEARMKLFDAEDALGDLVRTNAEEERKRIQANQAFEVELVLKKKESANAKGAILEQEIAKETESLEKRRKLILRLDAEEKKIQQEQFDAFNRGIDAENVVNAKAEEQLKKRVNFRDLVATKDAVALGRKIQLLKESNLSEEQTALVAKIVANAQNQQIENSKALTEQLKLEREERVKLNDIFFEEEQIQQKSEIDIIKEIQDDKIEIYKNANEEILENENVYNKQINKNRLEALEDAKKYIDTYYEAKQKLLIIDADRERTAAEESSETANVKALKIEKIDKQLAINQDALRREQLRAQKDINNQELEELDKIKKREFELYVEKVERFSKFAQSLSDEISKELQKQYEKESNAIDKQTEQIRSNIDAQTQLFVDGKKNQLAFEQQQLAKAELARRDLEERNAKRQEALQTAEALMQAYIAQLKQPNANPATAGIKAFAEVTLFKALAKTIVGSYYVGTDDTGTVNNPLDNNGGRLAVLHNNEQVWSYADRRDVGFRTRDEMKEIVAEHDKVGSGVSLSQIEVVSAIKSLEKTIESRPTQVIEVDKFGNLIEKQVKRNSIKTTVYKPFTSWQR